MGFEFNIEQTQKEEDDEDEESEGQRHTIEQNEQKPDATQERENERIKEGHVVPGQPMVIPARVSSSWDHFGCKRVIYYV